LKKKINAETQGRGGRIQEGSAAQQSTVKAKGPTAMLGLFLVIAFLKRSDFYG